jgi:Holliday junction resolvase RusA-like endonuclease
MRLVVSVRGTEPSTVKSGSTAWRNAIAASVEELFPEAPYTPTRGTTFTVDVEFHLVAQRLFIQPNWPVPPDLDNLLKPVLDTLFTSDGVVGPTGLLVLENDTYVTEVRARKTEAMTRELEGADITVTWDE